MAKLSAPETLLAKKTSKSRDTSLYIKNENVVPALKGVKKTNKKGQKHPFFRCYTYICVLYDFEFSLDFVLIRMNNVRISRSITILIILYLISISVSV